MSERYLSPAEADILEQSVPGGVADSSHELVYALYEALVLSDARCGDRDPQGQWRAQLQDWAAQAVMQLRHVSNELGGVHYYLPKNLGIDLSERDWQIWSEFRGDYRVIAKKYKLTEVWVRKIIERIRRAEINRRQSQLDL